MAAALALLAFLVPVQSIELLADVNQKGGPASSDPAPMTSPSIGGVEKFTKAGTYWYFVAHTFATGNELWRTDGTPGGTRLVKDIAPGAFSSGPVLLTEHGGLLYFSAGFELWRSDGTEAGTVQVADVMPGSAGSGPMWVTSCNGVLYFSADDGVHGREPWRTDGTAAGTQLLLDVRPGPSGSGPDYFHPAPDGQSLLFRAADGQHGSELWTTDGTSAGTALLADIYPGAWGSEHLYPRAWNGHVYFSAVHPSYGRELWRTDGTPGGTELAADLYPGAGSSSPDLRFAAGFGGALYFRADGGPGVGPELFASDGTPAGSGLVADIGPSSVSHPLYFVVHGGALYFSATGTFPAGVPLGHELWRIPAPGQPVELAVDVNPGPATSNLAGLVSSGSRLWMNANAGAGYELVSTDGTPAGTVVVELAAGGAASNPGGFTALDAATVLFAATSGVVGRELHTSDGTAAGTVALLDIKPGFESADSKPTQISSPDGVTLYFFADDGVHGREPWRWHPVSGASLVADIRPGSKDSEVSNEAYKLVDVGFTAAWFGGVQHVAFAADDGVHGMEPWVTDGTPTGTRMLRDIEPGYASSSPDRFQFFGGRLHFGATVWPAPRRAFVSDGTVNGTHEFLAGVPGTQLWERSPFERYRDEWWFSARTAQHGAELWRTDGTPEGTQLAFGAELVPGTGEWEPGKFWWFGNLVALDDVLCFTKCSPDPLWYSTGFQPHQLFATDGTLAGTTLLADATLGKGNFTPEGLVRLGDQLYFRAEDLAHGAELWRTDGTPAGTELFVDVIPGPQSSLPAQFLAADDRVFFRAAGAADAGISLQYQLPDVWMTDGTAAGTVRVIDGTPFVENEYDEARRMAAAAGGAYIVAYTPEEQTELHFVDGATGAAELVASPLASTFHRNPSGLTLANGALCFAGEDWLAGRELLHYSPAGAYAVPIGHSGSGAELTWTMPQLGEVSVATVRSAPSDALVHLLYYSAPAAAMPYPFLEPGSSYQLQSASKQLLRVAFVPEFSKLVPLPADPSLAGVAVHAQAFSVHPTPVLEFSSSNGVALVLGD